MLWCCASPRKLRSEEDQLEKEKYEIVVDKHAIKSIPLHPSQRLSPRYGELPRKSSKASQSTQTSLSMQDLELISIPSYENSPLSSYTKIDRTLEATNLATAYAECRQDTGVKNHRMLFTKTSPQEEAHLPYIRGEKHKDSSSIVYKHIISSSSEKLIYKPISDTSLESICNNSEIIPDKTSQTEKISFGFIQKEPNFVNEDVSPIPSLTKMTFNKNSAPSYENISSNVFPSSKGLIYSENLEQQTSITEDQNLTANMKRLCEKQLSEFCNKSKLSHTHSLSDEEQTYDEKHTSHCFLTTHKSQNEYNNCTDEACVSENPAAFSNNPDLKTQNFIHIQVSPSPSRRNISSLVSNPDGLEAFDNPAAVKSECQPAESKLCVITFIRPSLSSETQQTESEEIFQHSIANDTDLNEDKSLELDSNEELEAKTEETTMPHSVKVTTSTESNTDDKYSDKNTETIKELNGDTNKENEETIMSQFVKHTASTESKKTEISFDENTERTQELNVYKENEENIMPLTMKDVTSTKGNESETDSDKNSKSAITCLCSVNDLCPSCIHSTCNNSENANICLPKEKLEPMPKFTRTNSTENRLKKKEFTPERLSLFLATCINNDSPNSASKLVHNSNADSSEVETFKRKRKYKKRTSKSCSAKNISGVNSPKEMTKRANEVIRKTQSSVPQTNFHSEDERKSTSISSSEIFCQNSVANSMHKPKYHSKKAQKLKLPKDALQSWSMHQKRANSRKCPVKVVEHHRVLKSMHEPSTSSQNFDFIAENVNIENFETSNAGNTEILPNEYNPMYFENEETNEQNILVAEDNYEFPIQQHLYKNSKEVCTANQNPANACPHSSHTLILNTLPTNYEKIPMKEPWNVSCISPIQTENLKEMNIVDKTTEYKESKEFSNSDKDRKQHVDSIPKYETQSSDLSPFPTSSSYDSQPFRARSYSPTSQSSLATMQEREECTMRWTIIIKHVDANELLK